MSAPTATTVSATTTAVGTAENAVVCQTVRLAARGNKQTDRQTDREGGRQTDNLSNDRQTKVASAQEVWARLFRDIVSNDGGGHGGGGRGGNEDGLVSGRFVIESLAF